MTGETHALEKGSCACKQYVLILNSLGDTTCWSCTATPPGRHQPLSFHSRVCYAYSIVPTCSQAMRMVARWKQRPLFHLALVLQGLPGHLITQYCFLPKTHKSDHFFLYSPKEKSLTSIYGIKVGMSFYVFIPHHYENFCIPAILLCTLEKGYSSYHPNNKGKNLNAITVVQPLWE